MTGEAPSAGAAAVDAQVLELRCAGRSFPTIARVVGFPRADDASAAFVRAVWRRSPRDRTRLCDEELGRLDALAERVRSDATIAPFDADLQLERIARLRARLLADPRRG